MGDRSMISGEIAQLVEHTTENRGVPGSSPGLAIEPETRMILGFGGIGHTSKIDALRPDLQVLYLFSAFSPITHP